MKVYLILDVLTLLCPLLLSFDKRVAYRRSWGRALIALMPAGLVFIIWDVIATARGHWSFNPDYVSQLSLFGLPVEELLFFFAIPFACLFIYECMTAFLKEKKWPIMRWVTLALAPFALIPVFVFWGREYTMLVFVLTALFLAVSPFVLPDVLTSKRFWVSMGFIFIAFLIVNGVLTGLPVVRYNPAMIMNIRVGTIPLEDFFYNLTLMGFCIAFYTRLGNKKPV